MDKELTVTFTDMLLIHRDILRDQTVSQAPITSEWVSLLWVAFSFCLIDFFFTL